MRKRRYQEVAHQLKSILQVQSYQVGDKLPPERQLALQLSVSRSLLREALIMLEIEGLVDIRKGSGIYITDAPTEAPPQASLQADDIGPFELIQARQVLESSVAEMAAWQVTKNNIAEMHKILEDERQAINAGIFDYDNDKRFHLSIAQATQNSALIEVVENLWLQRERSQMWAQLHENIFDKTYRLLWLDDHQAILQALKRKSPSLAKQAMWTHLEQVRKVLLQLSDVENPHFDGFLFTSQPIVGIAVKHSPSKNN